MTAHFVFPLTRNPIDMERVTWLAARADAGQRTACDADVSIVAYRTLPVGQLWERLGSTRPETPRSPRRDLPQEQGAFDVIIRDWARA